MGQEVRPTYGAYTGPIVVGFLAVAAGAGAWWGLARNTTERAAPAPAAPEPAPEAALEPAAGITPERADPSPPLVVEALRDAGPPADCLDEVSCLLESDPPPCCRQYSTARRASPDTPLPRRLRPGHIRDAIAKARPDFELCAKTFPAPGTIRLTVTVAGDGSVSSASARGSGDRRLDDCLVRSVRAVRFARSLEGIRFTYPLVF